MRLVPTFQLQAFAVIFCQLNTPIGNRLGPGIRKPTINSSNMAVQADHLHKKMQQAMQRR